MSPAKQRHDNRHRWPDFIRRVNVFIRRFNRGEVLTFLLFVMIAAFFWIVQTSREENHSDFIIAFAVQDQPQDMVFTTHVPVKLKVTLSDTNSRLFNYSYSDRMDTLKVDFERYADAIGNFRISAAELQSLLREKLESSTSIVAVSPSLIDARFAQTEGRKYAVRLSHSYATADNYRMRTPIIEPDSVVINAPSSVLDTLKYVYAIVSNNNVLSDTLTEELPLDLAIGVKATPSSVKVIVPVAQYVEKVFDRMVVNVANEPENYHLVVFPYYVSLSCLVDFSSYREINESDFRVSVNYDDLMTVADSTHMPIHIDYSGPADVVTNVRTIPAQAEYVLERR